MNRMAMGKAGEAAAKRFLEKQGYKILACNYRCAYGEIDLICQDRETLVFVEVKTRSSSRFGSPAEAVTKSKQRRLYRLAQVYLAENHQEEIPVRFDVLSLTATPAGMQIEHHIGAF
ncbi:MAG: YraN family protein [candidate division WOR-3 bacterium]